MIVEGQEFEAGGLSLMELTTQIVAAYVGNNNVPMAELPAFIASVHAAMASLGTGTEPAPAIEKLTPAQIRKSITPEALVSFEDGRPYKALRRHLTLRGLTPEAYREKWGLPRDYPMTCQDYSEKRSALALSLGLGRKRSADPAPSVPEPEPGPAAAPAAPKKRGRPKAAAQA